MSKTPVTRRGVSVMVDEAKDASRTFEEWVAMGVKTLRLKCNYYNLPVIGSKETLAEKLVDKFREREILDDQVAGPSQNVEEDDYATDPYDANDSAEASDGPDDGVNLWSGYSDLSERSEDEDTPPKKKRRVAARSAGFGPPPPPNTPNPPTPAAPDAVPNPLGAVAQDDPGSQERLLQAEVRALRSKVAQLQLQQKTAAAPRPKQRAANASPPKRGRPRARTGASSRGKARINTSPPTHRSRSNTSPPAHRSRSNNPTRPTTQDQPQPLFPSGPTAPQPFQYQQRWGSQQQQHQQYQQTTPMQGPSGSMAPPPPPPLHPTDGFTAPPPSGNCQPAQTGNINVTAFQYNRFLPLSVKVSILRRIYRRDFVEFEELLPDNQVVNAGTRHESCISIDKASQTLRFDKDKIKKQKVDTLAKWLIAWTSFMQAYLHYHPEEFFELFTYLKNFVMLANRYRFEACLNYDRYFRLSMANQQTLSADLRSVSWLQISEEYRAMYLLDSPIPNCFHCKSRCHMSNNCPDKKGENSNNSSSVPAQVNNRSSGYTGTSTTFRRKPQPLMAPTQGYQHRPYQQQQQNPPSFPQPSQHQHPPVPAQFKVCFRYNGGFPCTKPPCQFAHACSICSDPHPATQCPHNPNSSSTFRPPPGH